MAQGDGLLYNQWKEQVLLAVYNFSSDTIKLTLHTGYTPNIDSHQVWADVSATEYTTAANYTAGGKTLASLAVSQDNTNDRGEVDAADVTWTSLGPLTPATPSHAILWDDTPTSPADPLIGYWELGTTATNGGNYTLQFGSEGFLWIT
jgi:hypothetical protein